MEENLRNEYEKVKDKISEEDFLERIQEAKDNNENAFGYTDLQAAEDVVKSIKILSEKYEESEHSFIEELSEKEYFKRIRELKKKEEHSYSNDNTLATMVIGGVTPAKENKKLTDDNAVTKIVKLNKDQKSAIVQGRVMKNSGSVPNYKNNGKHCNLVIADDTGSIQVTAWDKYIKKIENCNEGDLIKLIDVDVGSYSDKLTLKLKYKSSVDKLTEEECPNFPKYNEAITNIEDIELAEDVTYNIIARIIKIPNIRSYEKNGNEGKVASLELQDSTGKISYTLWNKNTELIDDLKLHEGDTVKIVGAVPKENRDGISLTHWDGRIVKGDFDIPDFEEDITPIGDYQEMQNITVLGVVTKLQDIKTFIRKTDGSEGKLRSFSMADGTGEIRVTLWGDDVEIDLNKGDIVKIVDGTERSDEYTLSGYSINTNWNTQIVLNPPVDEERLAIFEEIKSSLHPVTLEDIHESDDDGLEIDVVGRMMVIQEAREFERDDGNFGIVRSILLADGTGKAEMALWGDKASDNYKLGEIYLIENARIRLGEIDVSLNVGASSRIIELDEEKAVKYNIPSFEELEEGIYTYKSIDELDEFDSDIKVIARIIEVYEPHEFERGDGSRGVVRNIEIADATGSIRLALWDDNAEMPLEVDDPIKLENPRVLYNEDHLELGTTRNTSILDPSDEEIDSLPTPDELRETIYPQKEINALEDDDRNVRITGVFKDPSSNILRASCPSCGNRLEPNSENDDGAVCGFCGNVIGEPNYLLMLSGRFEDDTGEVQITFFDKLVEELLDMDKEEIISYVEEEGVGIFEGKLDDLSGMTMEVIANVRFDEYNEEVRLSPKKILDKYY